MASFALSFFPRDVLDEIWDLIETVSEGFPIYSFRMVPSFSLKPYLRRAIKEVSKVVSLDWINNQACSRSQNIYIITNLFITHNHLFEMIRKIIFTNYFF